MKRMKRLFILLIVLSSVISLSVFSLASCKKSPGNNTTNENGNAVTGSVSEESTPDNIDPRLSAKDSLPDNLDFGGKNFNILYPTWSMYVDYYFVENQNGEVLDDAIYKRQTDVEERLNVKINYINKGYIDKIGPEISKTVKAGIDEYSLALTHCIAGIPELIGNVYDWNKIPYADFSKPWWNQRMNEELSVQNVLLLAVSDLIIFDPNVIYFNKGMIKDLGLESPYDIVRSGKWTWSKLADMAKQASKDINGDGNWTKEDQYGFVTDTGWMMQSALQGCGMTTVTKTDGGELKLNLKDARFGKIIDVLYDLVYDKAVTYLDSWDANNLSVKHESDINMNTNRVLFIIDPLSAGKRYRAYDVEFGILPFPKLDEEQDGYRSLSWNGFMVIPYTADIEMAGAVSEALAVESYKYVTPAYYDIILTSKIARDEESRDMIDIIYGGACYDFAMNYTNWAEMSQSVSSILSSKKRDYISYVEKNETRFMNTLQKAYDKIIDNYVN